jgi:hypothetical protein
LKITNTQIYEDLSFEEYCKLPGLGSTSIGKLNQSVRDYKASLTEERESTDAMYFGKCVHMAILEPKRFAENVIVVPKFDRRTKAGKLDHANFVGSLSESAIVITQDQKDLMVKIIEALKEHKLASGLLSRGVSEVSVTGMLGDQPVKGRFDFLVQDRTASGAPSGMIVVDLKTTLDHRPQAFQREMIRRNLFVQAGLYSELCEAAFNLPTIFVFLVVNKNGSNEVALYAANPTVIECGQLAVRQGIQRYQKCLQTNMWPFMFEEYLDLSMPDYLIKKMGDMSGNEEG